jgi:hypothetical protein
MPNAQSESARRVGWGRRLSYAFIGLVAGNAAMDAYLLTGYVRTFILSPALRSRIGDILIGTFWLFLLYGTFSLIAWLIVGLPFVFLLPLRAVRRLPWAVILLISGALGPAVFLPIMLLLFRNQGFRHTGTLWLLSVIASVVGFSTYAWLVRRRLRPLTP